MGTPVADPTTLDPLAAPAPEEEKLPAPLPETEEIEKAAKGLVDDFETDDKSAHELISLDCRKYELYWQNVQDIIWDSSSRDWVSASGILQNNRNLDVDPSILDKAFGIYRAYGEIIAAALSTATPIVRFPPVNADSGADLTTARTSNVISDLISKWNDVQLLFIKALYTKFNQHFVAAYHTLVTDAAYGTVKRPELGLKMQSVPTGEQLCSDCGAPMMGPQCEMCGSMLPPTPETTEEPVPYVEKVLEEPRGRIKIEIYGPRQVKVQPYSRDIYGSPYLILETDLHEAVIKELYPRYVLRGQSSSHEVRQLDRRPTTDMLDTRKIHTLKRCWLWPWAFNMIGDEVMREQLKAQYPDGLYIVICDDQVLEMVSENMEDHWTFLKDPFAEYIHGDPKGKFVVPLQDMFNDTEMLAMETILHNIPEMFADPKVVNFKTYNDKEARPGQMNQATAPEGMNLSAGFYQPQGATLSKEVDLFLQRTQELCQFVVGAPPSIWGGNQAGGSGTLGEYQQSRAQAQQRLSVDWKMLNRWWADIMTKCVKDYRAYVKDMASKIKDPVYQENFVQKTGEHYINVWIRLEDLNGEVGEAEAQTSDQFPVSWEQQRGLLFELMQTKHPVFEAVLSSPENISSIRDILGIYKLKVPGEQDQDKQLCEIQQMLNGQQVEMEQFVDNHQVHWSTVSSWCNSPTGRDAKVTNPQGYQLIMNHAMQHYMVIQSQMAAAAGPAGGSPSEGPAEAQGSSQRPDTGGAKGEPPQR